MAEDTFVIVTARDEADRIQATLKALARAFPDASVWVADDGSTDATAELARACGARVVSSGRPLGKGAAATRAAREAMDHVGRHDRSGQPAGTVERRGEAQWRYDGVVLLCDGDLGESAGLLAPLVDAVRAGHCDLAVACFVHRVGGGLGVALGFARWAIRRRCGLELRAPISGQRAVRADALDRLLPFGEGFGMEIGMTIAAVRAGLRVAEVELDLSHRATGRTPAGFAHRARQLRDFVKVYRATAR
jgi:glycosyltransferase involved in cell wall biosynthesis